MSMSEHHWVRVTPSENIPPREGRAVAIGGRELAIFNLGDRFLATDNQCPHQGGPLCDGIVTGSSVVCPLHAWKVSLATGAVERPSSAKDHCVATYPVRVEDGIVVIGLPVGPGAHAAVRSGGASAPRSNDEVAA
jgi:nitrite reductase (NADH) small subunit